LATKSLTQLYNFGELANKSSLNNKTAQIEFPKNIIVKLTNLNSQSTILEKESYRSRIQYTKKDTKQIQFRVLGNEVTSVLEVSSPKYKSPVTNVSIKGSYIYYTKNGESKKVAFLE
jgi:peptidoglycan hydrolase-like amidase